MSPIAKASPMPWQKSAHNASGYGRATFLEMDPEQVRQSFDANVIGAVFLA
jgi:NAD(P)-dependent dehydrogenase (short-subunit alcohol dehydrogenase family)